LKFRNVGKVIARRKTKVFFGPCQTFFLPLNQLDFW